MWRVPSCPCLHPQCLVQGDAGRRWSCPGCLPTGLPALGDLQWPVLLPFLCGSLSLLRSMAASHSCESAAGAGSGANTGWLKQQQLPTFLPLWVPGSTGLSLLPGWSQLGGSVAGAKRAARSLLYLCVPLQWTFVVVARASRGSKKGRVAHTGSFSSPASGVRSTTLPAPEWRCSQKSTLAEGSGHRAGVFLGEQRSGSTRGQGTLQPRDVSTLAPLLCDAEPICRAAEYCQAHTAPWQGQCPPASCERGLSPSLFLS